MLLFSSADKKEEKMDDATFQLVDVALASLEKDRWNVINNSKTFEFVDWVCTVCTTGNPKDVVKSSYFTNLLRKVKWYAGDYPCILVQVLQFLERSPLLMKQVSNNKLYNIVWKIYLQPKKCLIS